MKIPVIKIDGAELEMRTPKARLWRELIKFEQERRNLKVEDFCDEHVKMIAAAFGVTVEEVLDNLDVDEILPTYMNVLTFVMELLTANLKIAKKNEEDEVATQV